MRSWTSPSARVLPNGTTGQERLMTKNHTPLTIKGVSKSFCRSAREIVHAVNDISFTVDHHRHAPGPDPPGQRTPRGRHARSRSGHHRIGVLRQCLHPIERHHAHHRTMDPAYDITALARCPLTNGMDIGGGHDSLRILPTIPEQLPAPVRFSLQGTNAVTGVTEERA